MVVKLRNCLFLILLRPTFIYVILIFALRRAELHTRAAGYKYFSAVLAPPFYRRDFIKREEESKVIFCRKCSLLNEMIFGKIYRIIGDKFRCGWKCGHQSQKTKTFCKTLNPLFQFFHISIISSVLLCYNVFLKNPALSSSLTYYFHAYTAKRELVFYESF